MWNAVSFYKHYRRGPKVSSDWRRGVAVGLAMLIIFGGTARTAVSQAGSEESTFRAPGNSSPALARLFTPRAAPPGTYEVRVLDAPIEAARKRLWEAAQSAGAGASRPDAWPIQVLDPLEAFGEAGAYPRTTVARLYTGTRAQVVRAPVERAGQTVAAVTLVSPYPDPTLSHLVSGTMVIVMNLEGLNKK